MKPVFPFVCAVALFVSPVLAQDNGNPSDTPEPAQTGPKLNYQSGTIKLGGDIATLQTGDKFRYLDPKDAETLLTKIWRNPKGDGTLGMLVPTGFDPGSENAWAVVLTYEETGYVKDDDAGKIDYSKLLKQMQDDSQEINKEREKQGYPPVALVGWATPPRYDASTHKLYWAKELQFGQEPDHTLNYNIRILGRKGVLVMNAVAPMQELGTVEKETPDILTAVNFTGGHRYADFNPGIDKIAAYGIGGLIAGHVLAKVGVFAMIGVFLLKIWKLILLVALGIGGFFKKLFGRKSNAAPIDPGHRV